MLSLTAYAQPHVPPATFASLGRIFENLLANLAQSRYLALPCDAFWSLRLSVPLPFLSAVSQSARQPICFLPLDFSVKDFIDAPAPEELLSFETDLNAKDQHQRSENESIRTVSRYQTPPMEPGDLTCSEAPMNNEERSKTVPQTEYDDQNSAGLKSTSSSDHFASSILPRSQGRYRAES